METSQSRLLFGPQNILHFLTIYQEPFFQIEMKEFYNFNIEGTGGHFNLYFVFVLFKFLNQLKNTSF